MRVCSCVAPATLDEFFEDISPFELVRASCPALSQVVVPDSIWTQYKAFCLSEFDDANFRPITWLAFRRGYLANFTRPIHRFVLDGRKEGVQPTDKCLKDLCERWFLKSDVMARFQVSKRFEACIAELRFAEWLERGSWNITNLEVYGGKHDVEASSDKLADTTFELKYLGTDTERFLASVAAIRAGVAFGYGNPHGATDYLLCRVYEAAKQLESANGRRVAAIILTDYSNFKLQLENNWIDWNQPKLFRNHADIEPVIRNIAERNLSFPSDMRQTIRRLDEVWIFRDTRDFELELLFRIDPKSGKASVVPDGDV